MRLVKACFGALEGTILCVYHALIVLTSEAIVTNIFYLFALDRVRFACEGAASDECPCRPVSAGRFYASMRREYLTNRDGYINQPLSRTYVALLSIFDAGVMWSAISYWLNRASAFDGLTVACQGELFLALTTTRRNRLLSRPVSIYFHPFRGIRVDIEAFYCP